MKKGGKIDSDSEFSREYQRELREKKYRNLMKNILKALAMGAGIALALSSPQGTRRFLKGVKDEWDTKNTRRALERLRERRLVAFQERADGTIEVLLTQEGRQKMEEWNLEELYIKKQKKWDGRWRMVAFDIAEKRKRAREAFRSLLKQFSFYQLQKSIFVCPYPCEAEIKIIRNIFHIPASEVLYFSTDMIPREAFLKKKFELDR